MIRCAGTSASDLSSMVMPPPFSGMTFEITRSSEVLPAPFGPITATASPARTSRLTPNRAWKVP